MRTFDKTMTPRFRARLLERALRLGETLEHETDAVRDAPREVDDFKDVAVHDAQAGVDEAQAAHAAVELEEIRAALLRIEAGSYGLCVDCGDAIDLRRLEALPAAACCASCQGTHEHATTRHA